MTKDEIENVIKRYKFISRALKENKPVAVFYLGNRKFTVELTQQVIDVCEIIRDVHSKIKDIWFKFIVDGILSDKTDVYLIMKLPLQKNAFYKRKDEFFNTVFLCCAAKNLISYDEILADVA